MSQINDSIGDEMATQERFVKPIKANQQSTKFVDPSEGAFTRKAVLIYLRIKQTFASALRMFAIAFIVDNVGNNPMIKASFSYLFT